jgi:hypothetical protein
MGSILKMRCAGRQRAFPLLKIISRNLRSATRGVSSDVKELGMRPCQAEGRKISELLERRLTKYDPSVGSKQV